MSFGSRLAKARRARGWSQNELSRRTEIHQGLISRMEHDLVKDPGLKTLRTLAITLGVTGDYLIGMYDGPERETVPASTETAVA